jgi:isocitrate dehydrogenase
MIMKATNGMFPHWFRDVCENLYGKKFFKNDLRALQEFMGIKNMNSLTPYVNGRWEQYEENLYKTI